MKQGFPDAICKIYIPNEATIMQEQFIDFATLNPSTFSQDARVDINIFAQMNPIGWWRMYGGEILPHTCYLRFLVHRQLKGVGLVIVSFTLLRGIRLPLREKRNWFICIVVFNFAQGSYLSIYRAL